MKRLRSFGAAGFGCTAPSWLLVVFCLLPLSLGTAAEVDGPVFYVSPNGNDQWSGLRDRRSLFSKDGPFATVHRALTAVRDARSSLPPRAPATIYLRGGTYFLQRPLEMTPEDSRLRILAYESEKPLLSAGRLIRGWKAVEHGTNRVFVAELTPAEADRWRFAELWVNGKRATRARHPNKGYLSIAELPDKTAQWTEGQARFQYREGDLDAFNFLAGAEIVAMTRWVESRLPVVSLEKEDRVVNLGKRSVFQLSSGDLYYVEGGLEMLDMPGEWCLDEVAARIFYFPRKGEKPGNLQAIAPVLTQIVKLDADPAAGRFIEDVQFVGLTFSHSEWNFPTGFHAGRNAPNVWPPPKAEIGGFAQAAIGVPGAVWGEGVRGSTFRYCTFENLGNYALELRRGCSSNLIEQCTFANLGAGGIKLGETSVRSDPNEQSRANMVTSCHIHDGGRMFHSAIAIWIGQSPDNRITHNLIHDFYYTGISVGWTWGYGRALATNNMIAFNHVHHIGVQSEGDGPILSDMGGIYTLSMQPGTRIVNNLWHDIAGFRYGGWGIYFDEGSSSILAESNIVYRTTHGGFHQHYGATNTVRNNIFAFARDHQVQRSRPEPHVSFSFLTNIVLFDSGVLLGGNWSNDNFRMNGNIYFDCRPGAKPDDMKFAGGTFEEWKRRGHDVDSVIADPLFLDPENNDFRLRSGSPALERGFMPIDLRSVGPAEPYSSTNPLKSSSTSTTRR